MVILVPTLVFNASAMSHHHKHPTAHSLQKCTYPHVTLYVYTQPVQKECVLLIHNGHIANAEQRLMPKFMEY